MKENLRLKSLIGFSLLIFLLPFLQTCSDKRIRDSQKQKSVTTETKITSKFNQVKESQKQKMDKEVWFEKAKKDNTVNAYVLGFSHYYNFEISNFKDKQFYIFSNFTLIILLTIVMLIISFLKKIKQIVILSSINLLLLTITTISLYLIEFIEDYKQIKYGYYLFALNSILIIIEAKRVMNRKNYR